MSDGDAGLTDLRTEEASGLAAGPHARARRRSLVVAVAGFAAWRTGQARGRVAQVRVGHLRGARGAEARPRRRARPSTGSTPPSRRSPTRCEETFAGKDTSTATGATNGIAGDIAVNPQLTSAPAGWATIVVNVEQLHSDNNLPRRPPPRRLPRVRPSTRSPRSRSPRSRGLSTASSSRARSYPFTLTGTLTVKETRRRRHLRGHRLARRRRPRRHRLHRGQAVGLRRRPHPHRRAWSPPPTTSRSP